MKDFSAAAGWFRKAAQQNDAEAQFNLGACYQNGEGVAKDYAEAAKWFRRAAEQNYADAQLSLGGCHYLGQGAAKDHVEAYAWISLAAGTVKDAAAKRDGLAKAMSPEQIFDGSKRMRELRAQIAAKLKSSGK